jgi:hypothetical protein
MEKKAVLYINVTDENEANGQDLYFQVNACTEYAKELGYTLYHHVFIDDSRKKDTTLHEPKFMFAPHGRDHTVFSRALDCLKHSNENIECMVIYNSNVLPKEEMLRKILFADLDIAGKKILSVTEGAIKVKTSIFFKILRFVLSPEGWNGPSYDPYYNET